jgi:hypothetical protein
VIEPVVTGAPFAVTEAVKVTSVCNATVDEEIVSVVVDIRAACAAVAKLQAAVSNSLEITRRNGTIRLQAEKDTVHLKHFLVRTLQSLLTLIGAKPASGSLRRNTQSQGAFLLP